MKNYQNIEDDIDQAVLGFGSTQPGNNDNYYLGAITTAPTSTQRRVQQAISLAQRLNEKQKELDKARSDLNIKDADLKRTQEELLITQELLSKSKHPSGYLIESLETKEKENLNLKQSLNKINNDFDYLKQENGDLQAVGDFLIQRLNDAQFKMKGLAMKRENIKNIQNILLNMVENNRYMDSRELQANLRAVDNMMEDMPERDDKR